MAKKKSKTIPKQSSKEFKRLHNDYVKKDFEEEWRKLKKNEKHRLRSQYLNIPKDENIGNYTPSYGLRRNVAKLNLKRAKEGEWTTITNTLGEEKLKDKIKKALTSRKEAKKLWAELKINKKHIFSYTNFKKILKKSKAKSLKALREEYQDDYEKKKIKDAQNSKQEAKNLWDELNLHKKHIFSNQSFKKFLKKSKAKSLKALREEYQDDFEKKKWAELGFDKKFKISNESFKKFLKKSKAESLEALRKEYEDNFVWATTDSPDL